MNKRTLAGSILNMILPLYLVVMIVINIFVNKEPFNFLMILPIALYGILIVLNIINIIIGAGKIDHKKMMWTIVVSVIAEIIILVSLIYPQLTVFLALENYLFVAIYAALMLTTAIGSTLKIVGLFKDNN